MLIILIALNGDRGQCGIAGDALRLAQMSVPCGESAFKQLVQRDLAARQRAHVHEVHVMDVNISVIMQLGKFRRHQVGLAELTRYRASILQHRSHGRIAVDVGVFALDIGILAVREGDLSDGLHETRLHVADA